MTVKISLTCAVALLPPPKCPVAKGLDELIQDMNENGQQTPISIYSYMSHCSVVDGRRRIAAAIALGWSEIEAEFSKTGWV